MNDDDFLYELRPPLRPAFERELRIRLASLPSAREALPEMTYHHGQTIGKWKSMSEVRRGVEIWVSLMTIIALGSMTIWLAMRALPGETQSPGELSPATVVQVPAIATTEVKPSQIAPTDQPRRRGPLIEIKTASGVNFSQIRVSGVGRMVHHVLDVSPKGDQLLVYAANLQASGTGASVVDSFGDLLYITDLDGNLLVELSARSKIRTTAPYVSAYWLKISNRIIFIDQDDQGSGVFSVNPDGSDRIRLTAPGETPLWLLPSEDDGYIFWQEGAWQTDEALILNQGKVARLGFYYQTALDDLQTTRIWEGLEEYDLVLSPDGDKLSGYPREKCSDFANMPEAACLTLQIFDRQGISLSSFEFPGNPRYFTWLPDSEKILVSVLYPRKDSPDQEIQLVTIGKDEQKSIPGLLVGGSDYWLAVQMRLHPHGIQVLFYHTAWEAPRILDLNTLSVDEVDELAPEKMCRTAGRCPDLTWIPVP